MPISPIPTRVPCTSPTARIPWLGGLAVDRVRVRHQPGDRRARRLSAGRDGQDHVPACAGRLARHARLGRDDGRRARHAGLAPSARRCRRQGGRADRRRVHAHVPRHRFAVGPADVGHLLGVGRAADLGAGAVSALSRRASRCGARSRIRRARRAPRRSSRWSARSICRSSNSRSIGGTRCTSRPRCSASAARRSIRRSSFRCSS